MALIRGADGRAGFGDWKATRRGSFLSEEFAGFPVNEMEAGAGEAANRHIGIGVRLVIRGGIRKPMLHVGAQLRAFEENMTAHGTE
jgi:hypothetical protein